MEFQDIKEDTKVYPGEYLLHNPSQQIVLCGAFKPHEGTIKAFVGGRLIEDKIAHFQQINLPAGHAKKLSRRGCGGCKK
tara:strand:- start:1618 stop:1854 length:237 start_codon:yes stop_codon:yes gene_type:complete